VLGAVKALAALDPAGFGLDDACAQLESSTYVTANEARPLFGVDPARRRSYREDLLGAIVHPSAVSPRRGALKPTLSELRCQLLSTTSRSIASQAIAAFDFKSRASVSASRHIHAHRLGAPTPCRRASSALHRITNVCSEFAGVPMEYVEHAEPRTQPISIARCRELLGEDAESMTDQDIEDVRRHAETMACIVVEMYEEQRRVSE
jgi:hypothetical protein